MQIAMGVLRGRAAYRASGLAAAQRLTEDRLQALRADPAAVAGLTSAERRLLLLAIGSTQRLVLRQRGIEDWLAGWQEAEADTGAGRG
jgi:hypothetical protein